MKKVYSRIPELVTIKNTTAAFEEFARMSDADPLLNVGGMQSYLDGWLKISMVNGSIVFVDNGTEMIFHTGRYTPEGKVIYGIAVKSREQFSAAPFEFVDWTCNPPNQFRFNLPEPKLLNVTNEIDALYNSLYSKAKININWKHIEERRYRLPEFLRIESPQTVNELIWEAVLNSLKGFRKRPELVFPTWQLQTMRPNLALSLHIDHSIIPNLVLALSKYPMGNAFAGVTIYEPWRAHTNKVLFESTTIDYNRLAA